MSALCTYLGLYVEMYILVNELKINKERLDSRLFVWETLCFIFRENISLIILKTNHLYLKSLFRVRIISLL